MKPLALILLFSFVAGVWAQKTPEKIYLFYSNDLRGGIEEQEAVYMNPNFPPLLGGGASAYSIISKYRKRAEQQGNQVLLLDAGNIFWGTNDISNNSKGLAVIRYMNKAGYDAMTAGPNDFKDGVETYLALSRAAHFPVLVANCLVDSEYTARSRIKPYTIIQKGDIKIGLFGIVSKAAEQADDPALIQGVHFGKEIPEAKKAVAALKAQGADIIIAMVNLGLPYDPKQEYQVLKEEEQLRVKKESYVTTMEFARFVPGIDVLISGGFNKGYNTPWEDPVNHTLCFQNYASGGNLGMVVLNMDPKSHKLSGYELPAKDRGLLLLSEDEFWPEKSIADSIAAMQAQYSPDFDKVIGVTRTTLWRSSRGESPMADLMCDAMRAATGADFAFNNFSGMRRDIPIGPITMRHLAGVFPFGNKIVLIKMSGKLLKELVETSVVGTYGGLAISGGTVQIDRNRTDGDRIVSFTVGGVPLDEVKEYTVATTTYLSEGNSGMSKLAFLSEEHFKDTDILVRKAVWDFIKKQTPLRIQADGRWTEK